jgi:hypothetical protein
MKATRSILAAIAVGTCVSALIAFQRPFREFPGREYGRYPLPPDWREPAEFVFGRLMYPPASYSGYGYGRGYGRWGGDWTQGRSSWTTDYPRSDRHFIVALRRLSRVHVRAVEQPINLDEGDAYDWPWLYAVEVGHWALTDAQARTLREYLLRGGFLMVDDFHGTLEWAVFLESLQKVFPDRPVVDIENSDSIFHGIYDLGDRYQVPGAQFVRTGRTFEQDGYEARWRGVYDDHNRLMVAICHNMDLGDAWEWADDPEYPEKYSALAIRIGVNYVVYAMTH